MDTIHCCTGTCNGQVFAASRSYRERYSNCRRPDRRVIARKLQTLLENRSFRSILENDVHVVAEEYARNTTINRVPHDNAIASLSLTKRANT